MNPRNPGGGGRDVEDQVVSHDPKPKLVKER
jgi:hypothetical protein